MSVSPGGVMTVQDCVVGGIDPITGDTIAGCPTDSTPPPCIPQGSMGPLAPGQSYCPPNISAACPSGMYMDPNALSCLPVPPTSSLIAGIPNTYLYVAGGILAFFLLKGKR